LLPPILTMMHLRSMIYTYWTSFKVRKRTMGALTYEYLQKTTDQRGKKHIANEDIAEPQPCRQKRFIQLL